MIVPEMSFEPPETPIVCYCPVCGGEIYVGDEVWQKEGETVCEWHLGPDVALWMGWNKVNIEEGR